MRTITYMFAGVLLAFAACEPTWAQCVDCDTDGHEWPADCNDLDPDTYPGAPETCDGVDRDCNGLPDDALSCGTSCDQPGRPNDPIILDGADGSAFPPTNPAIVWDGQGYGTAWHRIIESSGMSEVFFLRLSPAGVPLGDKLQVTTSLGRSEHADLQWTGSGYALSWQEKREGRWGIYLATLDARGVLLSTPMLISGDTPGAYYPSLEWNGSTFGVAWADTRNGATEIYYRHISQVGQPLGNERRVTESDGDSFLADLEWKDREFGMVWRDLRAGRDEIYFTRIDRTGHKLAPDSTVTMGAGQAGQPALAWNGTHYAVAALDAASGLSVSFALLDSEGQQVSSTSMVASPSTFNSSLALTPFGFATTYTRHPGQSSSNLDRDVFLRLLSPEGDLLTAEVQVAGSPGSNYSQVVSNGFGMALVWQGRHNAIYFTSVSCSCGPDEDGDGAPSCSDCDDADPMTHDNARQLCDGKNNQCDDPWWPAVPDDVDGDGWASTCDNCLEEPNPSQSDFDLDGRGDSCEEGIVLADADESGRTDGFDLVWLARAFGSHRGDPNYSPNVDLDRDDDVDGDDHAILTTFFGQNW